MSAFPTSSPRRYYDRAVRSTAPFLFDFACNSKACSSTYSSPKHRILLRSCVMLQGRDRFAVTQQPGGRVGHKRADTANESGFKRSEQERSLLPNELPTDCREDIHTVCSARIPLVTFLWKRTFQITPLCVPVPGAIKSQYLLGPHPFDGCGIGGGD